MQSEPATDSVCPLTERWKSLGTYRFKEETFAAGLSPLPSRVLEFPIAGWLGA